MIISIIKSGIMSTVNLPIKSNLKYIALPIKYSGQKVEPESNQGFRTNIQFTGNRGRDGQVKMLPQGIKQMNPEFCTFYRTVDLVSSTSK